MIYTAKLGNKYIIEPFENIPLKLDHSDKILPAVVTYVDRNTVKIYTDLEYNVGQFVSIGGWPTGGKYFRLDEVSITNYPVLDGAYIIEKEDL